MSETRYQVYDQMKMMAILLVIAGHCLNMYGADGAIPVMNGSRFLAALGSVVYRFHIPTLFFVSGALFAVGLKKGKYGVFLPFIKGKRGRLLIPYLFFAVFAVLPTLLICGLLPVSRVYLFVPYLISGYQVRHLWYLYCLFLVFALMWPFKRFLKRENALKVLLLSFVVSVAVRATGFDFLKYFQIGNTAYYQFFFVCGVLCEDRFDAIRAFLLKRKMIALIAFGLLLLSLFFDFYVFTGYLYAFAGIVLIICFSCFSAEGSPRRKTGINAVLVRDSYGVYLFHAMLVYLIYYAFSSVNISPYILAPVAAAVSLLVSLLLVKVLRCLGLEFIIGERKKLHE